MNNRKKYYLVYSGLFVLLAFFCFGIYLIMYKKSLFRFWDMYNQHYICFIKMGKWFRSIIRGGQFRIWDPAIGYGADFYLTISGSNSGSLFDPINWLSALIPARFAEYAFAATVFLRLYLCGITFSILAFRKNGDGYAVLCGALAYTFSACAYVGLYQFSFIVPMYVFPLVICGTDDLFEKNKPLLYTIILTLSALWSYYFTYMTAILVVVYCVIKWFCQKSEKRNITQFFSVLGRFTVYSILAAGMAAVVLLPVGKVLSGMKRLELKQSVPVLYDPEFYQNMLKGLVGTFDMGGRDCKIGFCLIAFLCLTGLFFTDKTCWKQLKIEIALMLVALCIPFAGHVMNGFSYIANRWIWAFALAVGMAVTVMVPVFRKMSRDRLVLLFIACLGYIWIVFETSRTDGTVKWQSLAAVLLGLCCLLFVANKIQEGHYRKLIVFLTCLSVSLQAYYFYSDKYVNYFSNNIGAHSAYEQVTEKGGLPLLNKINMSDGSRYVSYGLDEDYNAGWLYGRSGINFYYSCYDENVNQFHNSLAIKTSACIHQYKGLDNRSELMALMGVNHYLSAGGRHPTGYDILTLEEENKGKKIQAWQHEKRSSLFTRFDKAVSRTAFDSASCYDRQRMMTQVCVLDDEACGSIDLELKDESVAFEQKSIDDAIQFKDGIVQVSKKGAQMDLMFDAVENAEIYLCFENIDLKQEMPITYNISAYGLYENEKIGTLVNSFSGCTKAHHLYGGKHNWLLNLGAVPDKANGIRIQFGTAGTYTLDGLRVYARNRDDIIYNIHAMNHEVSNVSFPQNEMRVSVDNTEPEYLFTAVPYSEGWKAYDCGKPMEVLKADIGFMALKMEPGSHEIRFIYRTPGFGMGLLISLASVACFAVILVLKKRAVAKGTAKHN